MGSTRINLEKQCAAFLRDESGATAIEYGLIALGIGLAIISSARTVGVSLADVFTAAATGLATR